MSFHVINQIHSDPVLMRRIVVLVTNNLAEQLTLDEQSQVKLDMASGALIQTVSNLMERRMDHPDVLTASEAVTATAMQLDSLMDRYDAIPEQGNLPAVADAYAHWNIASMNLMMAFLQPLVSVISGGRATNLVSLLSKELASA